MHLTIRVAWHDNRWNGTVCSAPSHNSFCVALDRIREERDDIAEDQIAKQPWNTLKPDQMPSCIAESGGFMSPQEWTRVINHPYQANRKTESTHGHLQPTPIIIPPFSTSTVPFWWMLKEHQAETDESLPERHFHQIKKHHFRRHGYSGESGRKHCPNSSSGRYAMNSHLFSSIAKKAPPLETYFPGLSLLLEPLSR